MVAYSLKQTVASASQTLKRSLEESDQELKAHQLRHERSVREQQARKAKAAKKARLSMPRKDPATLKPDTKKRKGRDMYNYYI